jgi:hypothetical protein
MMAEHFGLFLKAVMLGILTRHSGRVVPLGQYLFAMGRGDLRRIGNERLIRQNGLHNVFHGLIESRVAERLAEFDAVQTVALAALASYYATDVYTPRVVSINGGVELDNKGFGNAIAKEIATDLRESARRKGMTDAEVTKLEQKLYDNLKRWANVIPESDADAHEWEVQPPGESGLPRLKFAIKPEMLEAGALQALFAPAAEPVPTAFAAATLAPSSMPSLAPVEHQYMLGIDNQPQGPYTAQQIAQFVRAGQIVPAATKVWREGMPAWVGLTQLPELASALFSSMPSLSPPQL